MTEPALYPCPCCGYFVFTEAPGSYDICGVCGWEDDLSQLRFVTSSGANAPLVECQRDFAMPRERERPPYSPEESGFVRDPGWRPLNLERDVVVPVPGKEFGMTFNEDRTNYYYWRQEAT